ncbi:MAG: DUF1343 domain-containing protein, partial [Leptospiraceae bacterium]|nr:DUF1343 domain-containing protein [Leptospiraceae bacterium]
MRTFVLFVLFILAFEAQAKNNPQKPEQKSSGQSRKIKTQVRTGLDELLRRPQLLKNKRIALITNHSAVDRRGRHILDLLHPRFHIAKIFAPEHGIRGEIDEHIESDGKDAKTGIPIISLYKKNKRAPSPEELADVDLLIFDIQEIGVRYYTYATTMILALKAAKETGKKMLVLDRPNPAAPLGVYGPLLEEKFHGGFAGYYPIPIAHGMTIGELAKYYNTRFGIGADLEVIKMRNYRRSLFYDETGLPWRKPSPNIPGMPSVIGYHLAGALESLNISVGRGTPAPFLFYGAPFMDAKKLVRELNKTKLKGVRFVPAHFKPEKSAHAGKVCHGF